MNEQVTIYALCEPASGEVRYIGRTQRALVARLGAHLGQRSRDSSPKGSWIRSLREQGLAPTIKAVAHGTVERAEALEREQIALHLAAGCALLNVALSAQPAQGCAVPATMHTILLTVPADLMERLRAEAQRRTLRPATAARLLVKERLDELNGHGR